MQVVKSFPCIIDCASGKVCATHKIHCGNPCVLLSVPEVASKVEFMHSNQMC